jgi:hypothetical protein
MGLPSNEGVLRRSRIASGKDFNGSGIEVQCNGSVRVRKDGGGPDVTPALWVGLLCPRALGACPTTKEVPRQTIRKRCWIRD